MGKPDIGYYRRVAMRRGYSDGFHNHAKDLPNHDDPLDQEDIRAHYVQGWDAGQLDHINHHSWQTSMPTIGEGHA